MLGEIHNRLAKGTRANEIGGAIFEYAYAYKENERRVWERYVDVVYKRTACTSLSPLGDMRKYADWDGAKHPDLVGYKRNLLYEFRVHAKGRTYCEPSAAEVVDHWGSPTAPQFVPWVTLVVTARPWKGLESQDAGTSSGALWKGDLNIPENIETEGGAYRAGNSPEGCLIWSINKPWSNNKSTKILALGWRKKAQSELELLKLGRMDGKPLGDDWNLDQLNDTNIRASNATSITRARR